MPRLMRKFGMIVLIMAVVLLTAHAAQADEIAKAGMKVYTNAVGHESEQNAINSATNDYGWLAPANLQAWLIVDLGRRYTVDTFQYQPRMNDAVGRIKDYEIYATDTWVPPATDPATVLTLLVADTWPNDNVAKDVAINQACRYIILKGKNAQTGDGRVGATEIYVYGTPATDVTTFQVQDPGTLSTKFMNANTINVTQYVVDTAGETIDGYLITEEGDVPAADDGRWQGSAPASYTIAGDPPGTENRQVILQARVRTASGTIACSARNVLFLTPLALAEIPKDTTSWQLPVQYSIIAGCSDVGYQSVRNAINGNYKDTGWLSNQTGAWLQLDLGGRYDVGYFIYAARWNDFDGRTKTYNVFVTDIPNDPLSWGDAVATGTFGNTANPVEVPLNAKAGRYVVFQSTSSYGGGWKSSAAEVYVYGARTVTVTDFEVADAVSGNKLFINSSPANVATFNVDAAGETIDGYMVTEASDVPAADDPRWAGADTVPATVAVSGDPVESMPRQVTLRAWVHTASGKVGNSAPITICYTKLALAEIPKNQMLTSASNTGYNTPANAINNNVKEIGWLSKLSPAWLQINLGGRYLAGYLRITSRWDDRNGRTKNYNVYMTDTADDPGSWGEPVASGTLANTEYPQEIALMPKIGRYLVFECASGYDGDWKSGIGELWVWGGPAATVTGFQVADRDSASTSMVNSPTVDVLTFAVDPAGDTVTGYMITQDDEVPLADDPRWEADVPYEYTITGDPPDVYGHDVAIQGWIKTAGGQIVGSVAQTVYYTSFIMVEIPKTKMFATTDSMTYGRIQNAIDGNANSFWHTNIAGQHWLKVDLAGRYTIGRVKIVTRVDSLDGRIKDYEMYLTDDHRDGDWIDPVSTGTMINTADPQDIYPTISTGRYLIIKCLSVWSANNYTNIAELWFYGQTAPNISEFALADVDSGSTQFINTSPASVTMFTVEPPEQAVTHFLVTEADDVPTADDFRWQTMVPDTFAIPGDPPTSQVRLVTVRAWAKTPEGDVLSSAPVTICYTTLPLAEVPKGGITVTASRTDYGNPGAMIDGVVTGGYWVAVPPAYVQFDLGARYVVGHFRFLNRVDDAQWRTKDFDLYVTDVPGEMTDPVASGAFSTNEYPQDVVMTPKVGRYVILNCKTTATESGVGGCEVWIYGSPAATVTSFAVADATTGSTQFLNGTTVDVTAFDVDAGGDDVTGYLVVLQGDTPAADDPRWQALPPVSFTLAAAPDLNTYVTFIGWIRSATGQVVPSTGHTMLFTDLPLAEIPKNQMIAGESGADAWCVGRLAIDGSTGGTGWLTNGTGWLRIDLGHRYTVGCFDYLGSTSNLEAHVKDYNVYVSDDMDAWGDPVATGTLVNSLSMQEIILAPKAGRYLVFEGTTSYGSRTGIGECWIYGLPQMDVTGFTVADQVSGSPKFITSLTVDVTDFTTDAQDETITHYMIAEGDDVPAADDARWQAAPPDTCTITGEPALGSHVYLRGWVKSASGTIACSAAVKLFYSTLALVEVPKNTMTASASSTYAGTTATGLIDGAWSSWLQCWLSADPTDPPQWVQLDLGEGSNYTIGYLSLLQRQDEPRGWTLNYEIYVSNDPVQWGTPIVTGTLLTTTAPRQDIILPPTAGRYLTINVTSRYVTDTNQYVALAEAWVYGAVPPAGPAISAFTAADQSTGSTLFTNSATVDVSMTVVPREGSIVDGYLITESDVEPVDGWLPDAPATYTITGPEGAVTLYAWAKDDGGGIGSRSATIQFSTAAPVVSNVAVTDNADSDPPATGTATATWDTDIPAEGAVQYGPVSMAGATPNTVSENGSGFYPPGTAHSVTFATAAGANYKINLINNEAVYGPIYWPRPWPIDGDANMDCRVNILDLIFFRNKLNQSVGTGDNWKADVNEDTRINILDLIFVRNKLNTSCP